MTPEAYRELCKKAGVKAPRAKPELHLQIQMAQWLRYNLRLDVMWTASLSGVYLGWKTLEDAVASGLERGWPDLSFFCSRTGRTFFVEVKAESGLTPEQRRFRNLAQPHGVWAVCRSLDSLQKQVAAWGLVKAGAR